MLIPCWNSQNCYINMILKFTLWNFHNIIGMQPRIKTPVAKVTEETSEFQISNFGFTFTHFSFFSTLCRNIRTGRNRYKILFRIRTKEIPAFQKEWNEREFVFGTLQRTVHGVRFRFNFWGPVLEKAVCGLLRALKKRLSRVRGVLHKLSCRQKNEFFLFVF